MAKKVTKAELRDILEDDAVARNREQAAYENLVAAEKRLDTLVALTLAVEESKKAALIAGQVAALTRASRNKALGGQ